MINTVPDQIVPTGRKNRNGVDTLKPPAVIAHNKVKKKR